MWMCWFLCPRLFICELFAVFWEKVDHANARRDFTPLAAVFNLPWKINITHVKTQVPIAIMCRVVLHWTQPRWILLRVFWNFIYFDDWRGRGQLRLFDKLASLFIFTLPKIQRCVLFGIGRMSADGNTTQTETSGEAPFGDWSSHLPKLMLLAVSTARCMLQGLRCSHIEGKSKRHRTTKHRKEIKRSNTFPLSLCLCVCSHYMLSFYLARNARTCNICLPYTALVRFVCILLDMRWPESM